MRCPGIVSTAQNSGEFSRPARCSAGGGGPERCGRPAPWTGAGGIQANVEGSHKAAAGSELCRHELPRERRYSHPPPLGAPVWLKTHRGVLCPQGRRQRRHCERHPGSRRRCLDGASGFGSLISPTAAGASNSKHLSPPREAGWRSGAGRKVGLWAESPPACGQRPSCPVLVCGAEGSGLLLLLGGH